MARQRQGLRLIAADFIRTLPVLLNQTIIVSYKRCSLLVYLAWPISGSVSPTLMCSPTSLRTWKLSQPDESS